jgi:hypothetical protein
MLLDALDLRDFDVLAELLDRLEAAGIHFSEMDLARELLASIQRSRDVSPASPPPEAPGSPILDLGEQGRVSHSGSAQVGDGLQVHNFERRVEPQLSPRTPPHDPLRIQAQDHFETSQGSVTTDSPSSPVLPARYDEPIDSRRLGGGRSTHSQRREPEPLAREVAGSPPKPDHGSVVSHWQANLHDVSSPGGDSEAFAGLLSAAHTPEPAGLSGSRSASSQSTSPESLPGCSHSGAAGAGAEPPRSSLQTRPRGGRAPSELIGTTPPADVPVGEGGRTPVPETPDLSTSSLIQTKVYGAPVVPSELVAIQAQASQTQSTRGAIPLCGIRPSSSRPAAAQAPKSSIAQTIMKFGARASFSESDSDLSEEMLPETRNDGDDSDGFD